MFVLSGATVIELLQPQFIYFPDKLAFVPSGANVIKLFTAVIHEFS